MFLAKLIDKVFFEHQGFSSLDSDDGDSGIGAAADGLGTDNGDIEAHVLIGLADLNHGHGLAASEFAAACYAGICAFKCLYGEDGAVAHENGLADVETRAFLRDFFPKMHHPTLGL